jgi:hypothetical protein
MMFSAKLFTIISAVFAIAVNGSPIAADPGSPNTDNKSPAAVDDKTQSQAVRRPCGPPDVDPCVDVDDGEI